MPVIALARSEQVFDDAHVLVLEQDFELARRYRDRIDWDRPARGALREPGQWNERSKEQRAAQDVGDHGAESPMRSTVPARRLFSAANPMMWLSIETSIVELKSEASCAETARTQSAARRQSPPP